MDVALEMEERVETENYTANSTDSEFYYGLHPQQLAGLSFSLFCLAPNILLTYIICKNRLNSTVHSTMAHWSVLNSALVLNFMPFHIMPLQYITSVLVEVLFYFGVTLATCTGVLATLSIFDFYFKSEKVVKYSTITIWSFIVLCDVCILGVAFIELMYFHFLSIIMEICIFVINFIFLVKIIYSWTRPRYDESYRLRKRLSSIYSICLFLICLTDYTTHFHAIYAFITLIATVIIYLDGYVNLVLLIYFDPKIKRYFMQMFCASDKYSDIKFDAQNSTVSSVN